MIAVIVLVLATLSLESAAATQVELVSRSFRRHFVHQLKMSKLHAPATGRKRRQETLQSFFATSKTSTTKRKTVSPRGDDRRDSSHSTVSSVACELASRLDTRPTYLTPDKASWYLQVKRWLPSTPPQFSDEWDLHPTERHPLKLFGKTVYENRWSQAWGVSYPYSGNTNDARPIKDSTLLPLLIDKVNGLSEGLFHQPLAPLPYNGCLQNWYEPNHTIGLHADDEKKMRHDFPIFSLSWGGTRRFLLRSRASKETIELWLQDGDLLVMGGTCQLTHRHEVPKRRVTMDPPTRDRINWTIRAFVPL